MTLTELANRICLEKASSAVPLAVCVKVEDRIFPRTDPERHQYPYYLADRTPDQLMKSIDRWWKPYWLGQFQAPSPVALLGLQKIDGGYRIVGSLQIDNDGWNISSLKNYIDGHDANGDFRIPVIAEVNINYLYLKGINLISEALFNQARMMMVLDANGQMQKLRPRPPAGVRLR